ncbi:hypothetical protein GCM10012280_33240 [Wenjunlia tyrosinilytica]|uniref:Uncharacterized protein n=1 Tax=Wenjunlia tyrosinilytica TaxID=1544741 RepID=A0A917ZR96_9ACTN|nr:hypothetical protein GCM10012280_33240 [Wenjunlia tyrosinilytica]
MSEAAETAETAETAEAGGISASRVYYTTSEKTTKVRSGPSTSHRLVRTLPKHSAVNIGCQCDGEKVSGPYGTSKIWDRIAPGQYIPDAYVHTGSDGYVAPRC